MAAVIAPPGGVGGSTRRERVGWYLYGWADHAFYTTVLVVVMAPYMSGIADAAADADGYVHPLGLTVAAGSYYPYLVSLSAVLSVILLPIIGGVADRTRHKRRLLGTGTVVGVTACSGFFFVTGDRYLLGGGLFMLAIIALGAAGVVYNSFLPQLAGPDQRDAVSSVGWSVGYIGGGLHLALCLIAFNVFGTSESVSRWVMVSAGVWWAFFSALSLVRMRDHVPVAASLPAARYPQTMSGNVFTSGFRQLRGTLRSLRSYPLTLTFLAAYLVYNDGIQTVISQAGLYATRELKLGTDTLAATILMIQFIAFFGALLLGRVARRFGARKTILASLVMWCVVVLAAFWLPSGSPEVFITLGAAIGLILGGSQALSRSLFSQLIPRGKEAEYFSFYAIADKGMSWSGPLVFGVVYQVTHQYRLGIISLLVFFIVGFLILLAVPIRRAIVAVGNVPPHVV